MQMLKKPESYRLNACQRRFHLAAFFFSLSLWLTLLTAPSLLAEEPGGDAAGAGKSPAANSEPSSEGQSKDKQVQDDAHHRTNATCLNENYGPLIDLRREFGRIRRGEVAGLSLPDYRIDGWEETRRAAIEACNQGDYKQAARLAKSLRIDARSMLGRKHLGYAISTEIELNIPNVIRKNSTAEYHDHLVVALIYRLYYGKQHPVYAACLTAIGMFLANSSDVEKSLKALDEAREIQEAYYAGPHAKTAHTFGVIAYAHGMAGRTEEAIQASKQCEELFKASQETLDVVHALDLDTYSIALIRHGRLMEAEELLDRVDRILQQVTHEKDPRRSAARISRAILYRYSADHMKTYEYQKTLLAEIQASYGRESPLYLDVLGYLCDSADKVGHADQARKYHEELLGNIAQFGGVNTLRYTIAVYNLGIHFLAHDNLAEAEKHVEMALDQLNDRNSYEHPIYGEAIGVLGFIKMKQGDLVAAEELLTKCVEISRERGRLQSSTYLCAKRELGELRIRQGRVSAGLELLDEAIAIEEAISGQNHPNVKELRDRREQVAATIADEASARP